jgi:signal transduction histidine kinase
MSESSTLQCADQSASTECFDETVLPDGRTSEARQSHDHLSPRNEKQLNGLLRAQERVLDKMAKGASLTETMHSITEAIEETIPSTLCAFAIFDQQNHHVELSVAPNLPTLFVKDLENLNVSVEGMSADIRKSTVGSDAKFQCRELRELVVSHGMVPRWTVPIRNERDLPLGVLGLCSIDGGTLVQDERRVIHAMTQLSRFAIEHERRNVALKSADVRFASLAASIPGVVYQRIVDQDGGMRYSYISEGAKELFGVASEEIIADPQALFNCHGPDYAATFRDRILKASRDLTMWDVEATIVTHDGRPKFTHAIARPTQLPDGSVQWDGVILDATRIKEAELAAAAAETRTRDTIVESLPHGFVLFDSQDQLVTFNAKLLDFYPQLRSTMTIGASYTTIVKAEIENGLDVEGLTHDPETGAIPTPEQRLANRLERRAQTGRNVERRLSDGRWILMSEHHSEETGTVILHTDVTELKDREAALERSNRELQDFASVASHDLQEPLRKIEAFGSRLKAKYSQELGEDGRMYIERMENAADRMRNLINDLLAYSRVTTKARSFAPVDLEKCTGEVVSDLQVAIESTNAQIEVSKLPTIYADPTQVAMLLQNLIANAIKFHRDGIAPHIKITSQFHRRPPPGTNLIQHGQEVCEIRVDDNGIGFDMKYLDRIFGIFQRLHGRGEYEGTGVGLATCKKIVERHDGTITAESTPGQGATFIIYLPMNQGTVGALT